MEYILDGQKAELMFVAGRHNEEKKGTHLYFGNTDYGREHMNAGERFRLVLLVQGEIVEILSAYHYGDSQIKRNIGKEIMGCLLSKETVFYN